MAGAPPIGVVVRDARKAYGSVLALDGISIEVSSGAVLALVGESGSGKTTLLRALNALTTLDAGTVLLNGAPVSEQDPVTLRRSIGYVQQSGGLLPHWTALENATLVPRLLGWPDARERGRSWLDRVGLPPTQFGDRWPAQLSGGQRQRVALARALAAQPGLLLLDEPFGALDAITRFEVHETFLRVTEQTGCTTVLVTHDLREALRLADCVAVMREGRILQSASAEEVVSRPKPGYVTTLFERAGFKT